MDCLHILHFFVNRSMFVFIFFVPYICLYGDIFVCIFASQLVCVVLFVLICSLEFLLVLDMLLNVYFGLLFIYVSVFYLSPPPLSCVIVCVFAC